MKTDPIAVKIASITNEVKELHPLLKVLLPKIPTILNSEYTHGVHEMGADFVLEKLTQPLGQIQYVGIIAKCGKIVQDFSDVERQIEECEVERLFGAGRKKVVISEIWVIATDTISNGAQQKIHSKYKTRSIHFIDGNKLTSLTQTHLPNYGVELPIELGEYLHSIRTQNAEADKSLTLFNVKTERFYVEQDIYERNSESYRGTRKKHERVNIQAEIEKNRIIIVEGGMGAGKSKLLRTIIDSYSDARTYAVKKFLPVYIPFSFYAETHNGDLKGAIEAIVPKSVAPFLSDSKVLALVDGLDEKDMSHDQQIKKLEGLVAATDADPRIHVVLTSRFNDAIAACGELDGVAQRLELRALSMGRLLEFLKLLCNSFNVKDRIVRDIEKSSLFKQLPKSPIAAILLANLLQHNSKELPSNLTELYAKYMELMLGRWDIEKGLQSQKEFEAMDNILMRLADYMMSNQLDRMGIEEAKKAFVGYLAERNLDISAEALFKKMVQRCEVIAANETTGHFYFKHRTFLEFFYARRRLREGIEIDARIWNPYWANSYFFYVGLRKDCPEILKAMTNLKPTNEPEALMRIINLPSFLLAGFSSPYSITIEAIESIIRDAGAYYTSVIGNPEKSLFGTFPRMRILWITQYLLRQSCSYDFFKRAIEIAANKFDSEGPSRESATALFFAGIVGQDIGIESPFDLVLDRQKQQLPLEFQLAIRHEADHAETKSALVKKFDKQVERMLKANKKLASELPALYDKPLAKSSIPTKRLK